MKTELTFCNCANCGKLLLGDYWRVWFKKLPLSQKQKFPTPVAKRRYVNGHARPLCMKCVSVKQISNSNPFWGGKMASEAQAEYERMLRDENQVA